MEYLKDKYGKDLLFDKTNNFQVMMEWEKPYMEALIDRLNPTGDVLEIGFGLGYSANRIQSFDIKSHTIIENDEEVLEKLKIWALKQKHKVNIVSGLWQEELKKLGKFDSVFFDDSPNEKYEDKNNIRLYEFYYKILKNHATVGSQLSWYCDAPIYWIAHPQTDYSNKIFNITIPTNVEYVSKYYKNTNTLYMPLITFTSGTVNDILPICLDNTLNTKFLKLDN